LKVIIKSSFNDPNVLSQCDYEQMFPIGYNYNQYKINDMSYFD